LALSITEAVSAVVIFESDNTRDSLGAIKHHPNAAMNAAIVLVPECKKHPEGR